jgi:hypothetical protein
MRAVTSKSKSLRGACALLATSALLVGAACSHRAKQPAPAAAVLAAATVAPATTTPAPAVTVHGIRRLARPDVPVYVDGKQVGVMTYGELPPSMKTVVKPGDETADERYYRLTDYLKAVGVSTNAIKAIHFKGSTNRIMSVTGTELRADRGRYLFDFSLKDTGLPREGWSLAGLSNTTWVDYVHAVYVYANAQAPKIDPKHHCYWSEEDNDCQSVAPYSGGDIAKGTRVYEDGKLLGYVKRRRIDDSMIVGKKDDGTVTYSLAAAVASFGADLAKATTVELLSGDHVVARATREQWLAKQPAMYFILPKHGHGKVQALVPADLQAAGEGAKDREATVTAIQIYENVGPSARPLTALDEIPEVATTGEGDEQAALGPGNGRANEL